QRDRVGELQPAQTHAASRRVPQRRGTDQTAVLGATQHQQEMDDADPRLEGSTEPIYDPIRGKASSAVNPIAGYTKICTPSSPVLMPSSIFMNSSMEKPAVCMYRMRSMKAPSITGAPRRRCRRALLPRSPLQYQVSGFAYRFGQVDLLGDVFQCGDQALAIGCIAQP